MKEYTEKFGQTDILLNNAEVKTPGDNYFDQKIVEFTLKTNFFSTVDLTLKITPLIKKNGKIIAITSSRGKLSLITKDSLLKVLTSEDLTIDYLK